MSDRPGATGGAILVPGSRANNLLRFGLLVVVGLVSAWAFTWNHGAYNFARDIDIPLQAADRWLAGSTPYVASDFAPDSLLPPFMYPPFVLPIVAPLSLLPRTVVDVAWVALLVVAACWTLRTLGIRAIGWPLVFIWPPLAEAVFAGNVQVLLAGALVALYYRRPAVPREVTDPRANPGRIALLSTVMPAIKIGQFHAWLHVLRRRPRAALLGAAVVAALAARDASAAGGNRVDGVVRPAAQGGRPRLALRRLQPGPPAPYLGYAVVISAAFAVLVVKGPRAGALIGALMVVGAPSLYLSGTLMLLPALVTIRREIALIGAALIATSTYAGAWLGILIVAVAISAAGRSPGLLEPAPNVQAGPDRGSTSSRGRARTAINVENM